VPEIPQFIRPEAPNRPERPDIERPQGILPPMA